MKSLLLVWGLFSGCARQEENLALLCLSDSFGGMPGEAVDVEADAPLVLHVQAFGGCHMADFAVQCSAVVEDGDIVVSTTTNWVRTEPLAMSCESALLITASSCETPPLPEGSYTVRYADQELDLQVPGPATGCITPSRD